MLSNGVVQRLVAGVTCLVAIALLDGCHRRQVVLALPVIAQAPDILPPAPPPPVMESSLPDEITTVSSPNVVEIKPRRSSRRTLSRNSATEASAPVDTANTDTAPEASSLGELSAGGNSIPQTQQDAADLISSSEHRLTRLSTTLARQQQAQLRKVRYFLKQAKQALGTGDAEGAKTLATKAKLLLDDLTKS